LDQEEDSKWADNSQDQKEGSYWAYSNQFHKYCNKSQSRNRQTRHWQVEDQDPVGVDASGWDRKDDRYDTAWACGYRDMRSWRKEAEGADIHAAHEGGMAPFTGHRSRAE
jgi:hypothetical protein